MTQKEFAEKLGIHGATLSAYELGNNKPSIDVVLKISSTFGVTIDWLFGLSNENTRNKSINNYSQVLEDLVTVSLSIERSSFKLSKEDSENAQLPESIDIEDPIIQHFLNTWAPVLLLYQNNTYINMFLLPLYKQERTYNMDYEKWTNAITALVEINKELTAENKNLNTENGRLLVENYDLKHEVTDDADEPF